MNNRDINTLRQQVNRAARNVDGIAKAAQATLIELDAISEALREAVVRPNGESTAERPSRKLPKVRTTLTEDDVIALVRDILHSNK